MKAFHLVVTGIERSILSAPDESHVLLDCLNVVSLKIY